MDVFTLLEFWRNAGANTTAHGNLDANISSRSTVITASVSDDVRNQPLQMYDDTGDESFFDLVFTEPDGDGKEQNYARNVDINVHGKKFFTKDRETRFSFVGSSNNFFFNRNILPIEPTSKPQSSTSLLKSPPKFRAFMLGLKKSKLEKTQANGTDATATLERLQQKPSLHGQSKRFTVECEHEEVPIASLLTRDSSLRSKLQKEISDEKSDSLKRIVKDGVHKYFKLIKPLYVIVSKRYRKKMRFPNQFSTVTPLSSPAPARSSGKQAEEKHASFPAGFRVACNHTAKSRLAVDIMPSQGSRRDGSLLQKHEDDGIQSAILHCKRSYNSSSKDSSVLSRSVSDSKSINSPRNSAEEGKRCSI
ncbi:unnamed protein product [Ilex paraguariensis]|uniref:Membrane-associated kinase regulator 2 n=1 Tax=Ilex paraguariensis TaxID=185542 RepID=A0ABC8U5B6_9AQUA